MRWCWKVRLDQSSETGLLVSGRGQGQMAAFQPPDSCFRVPLLEAGAFPGQLLVMVAYYMQIRETFEATCMPEVLPRGFGGSCLLKHKITKSGDHSLSLVPKQAPMASVAGLSLGARDWSGDRDVASRSPESSWCLASVQAVLIRWAVGGALGWCKPGVGSSEEEGQS